MRKSTIEKMIKGIEEKETLVASFPLVAKFEGFAESAITKHLPIYLILSAIPQPTGNASDSFQGDNWGGH
jgi:hypothetical protein